MAFIASSRRLLARQTSCFSQFYRTFYLPEYQSKILMNEYDLSVQDFRLATSVIESEQIVAGFRPKEYVIKAQVHAGGRLLGYFKDGFKGGIHFTKDPFEVPVVVSKMIGNRLITRQTTEEGELVNEVMIAEALKLKKELYLAILLDREFACPVVITSPEGGVNIEDIAKKNPGAIHKQYIDMDVGITQENTDAISSSLGFEVGSSLHTAASEQISRLFKLFVELDCLQVEINPFGECEDGSLVNMDAKFTFDSNAAYRQPRVVALAIESRRTAVDAAGENSLAALEFAAEAHGLNYIGLPGGNIGCMVNGAGLAMATMDILQLFNSKATNFLDLGGRATQSDVEFALKTLNSDSRVRCILINIFGGIVDCRMVSQGIVDACRQQNVKIPLVVRLEGTNARAGRGLLSASGLNIEVAADMEEAAILASRAANN